MKKKENKNINDNNNSYNKIITLIFEIDCNQYIINANPNEKFSETIEKLKKKYQLNFKNGYRFFYNTRMLKPNLTLIENKLENFSNIFIVKNTSNIKGAGCWFDKNINIKFIKFSKQINNNTSNYKLIGLLKLCLLKEISSKLNEEQIKSLPELLSLIMRILKNGNIDSSDGIKETIQKVLKKLLGSNIINFSNYIDEEINIFQINKLMKILNKKEFNEINDISFRLSKYNKYMKLFNEEFEKAKKESIFEFSVTSLVIIEREDLEKFEIEREKCPNRVDKILFHGTSVEPISCILTGLFKKSIDRCCQHGNGVYFTDFLDYCWFYGGEASNRANKNKIPGLRESFTLIACIVYYNKKGFRKVIDYKYTPKKNEINFAYAGAKFETIDKPDFSKFVGTEYVIWDLVQICPFISAKLQRNEFCVIWRDNNFSPNPVYNNEFDELFKNFLNERMKYIKKKWLNIIYIHAKLLKKLLNLLKGKI